MLVIELVKGHGLRLEDIGDHSSRRLIRLERFSDRKGEIDCLSPRL